jgi:Mg-chelatase subunit ChlD
MFMKRISWLRLRSDRSGSVLMLFGLSVLFLVAIGGAGYDLGRQQLVRQKIQQASDSAALAGSAMVFGTSAAARTTTANRYFALNYPASYLGVARPTPTITIGANDVQVSATTPVVMNFVSNLGVSTLNATGLSKTQFKKGYNKIDLILALDNSGSMGTNFDVGTLKTTPAGPGTRTNCINGWISYFAYFGAALTVPGANSLCITWEGATGFSRVNALRFSAMDITNLLMSPNPNDNRIAAITWDLIVMNTVPFTNNPAPINAFISTMYGRGATNSTSALTMAQSMGATGFRSGAVHAVVLMTDGANFSSADPANSQATFNASSMPICNALKASGTLIFTVGFGTELANASASSAVARQFLSDCASGPNGPTKPNLDTYYFVTPDSVALNKAFTDIAGTLQALRILN